MVNGLHFLSAFFYLSGTQRASHFIFHSHSHIPTAVDSGLVLMSGVVLKDLSCAVGYGRVWQEPQKGK